MPLGALFFWGGGGGGLMVASVAKFSKIFFSKNTGMGLVCLRERLGNFLKGSSLIKIETSTKMYTPFLIGIN